MQQRKDTLKLTNAQVDFSTTFVSCPEWQWSCCFCSVTKCPTLCDPMDWSTPGFLVLHISWSLLKLTSIESMMPSNHLILLPPSPLTPNLSQHHPFSMGQLFTSGDQRIGASASVLPMNIQGWFPLGLTVLPMNIQGWFPLELTPHIKSPMYWSFSISPSSEYSGLISFRFDFLTIQGTLKSIL